MRNKLICLAVAGIAMGFSADASLVGDTVHGLYKLDPAVVVIGPDPGDPHPENYFSEPGGSGEFAVVGDGPEFVYDGEYLTITADLSSDSLTLDYAWDSTALGPFGPIVNQIEHFLDFSDLDWDGTPGTIVGFELVSGTADPLQGYSFTSDSLRIRFDQFALTGEESFHLEFDIEVENGLNPVPVPAPAALTLMGLGIVGLLRRYKAA